MKLLILVSAFTTIAVALVGYSKAGDASLPEYDLDSIKSLDEVQGFWGNAPSGVARGGLSFYIKGKKATCYDWKTPDKDFGPVEADVELVDGVLILRTDAPWVDAKKWHLATSGKSKCLVALLKYPLEMSVRVVYYSVQRDIKPTKGAESEDADLDRLFSD
jgi:hypothetical protein